MPFPYTENPTPASTPRIDAVLFDYGQVLSGPPDPAAWARLRSITGLDEARLHEAYWKFRHDYDSDTLNGQTYWDAVAAHAGITLDAAQRTAILAADTDLWSSLNPPMVEWAARLQRAGIRTGILSNIGDSMAQGLTARFPWLAAFTHCTWSYALHMAKPDPAIYLRTAESLNASPAHILFIDDREENVAAAVALGFPSIQYHYAEHPAFEQEMHRRGFASLLNAALESSDSEIASTASATHP